MLAVAALFSLSSCIDVNNSLGSSLVPSNQDISLDVVEFDLPVDMMMSDSLQTHVQNAVTFGAVNTETFGKLRVSGAFSITPANDSIILGDDPVLKEMRAEFSMSTGQSFGEGNAYIPQNIRIRQLNRELDSTTVFNNSIGDLDVKAKSAIKESVVYTGGTSFTVYFTDEFADPILDLSFKQLDSAQLFMQAIYGLYISVDEPEDKDYGGRLNQIDLSSSNAYLTYTSTNKEGRRRDTTIVFSLGAYYTVSRFDAGSGRLVDKNPEELLYVDGYSGVKPHIDAKNLKLLMDKWAASQNIDPKNILVAKASMEFPFVNTENPDDYENYPKHIFPCRRKLIEGVPYYLPLSEEDDEDNDRGEINFSRFIYKMDAGSYIQEILKKDINSLSRYDDIWIMPTVSISSSSDSELFYADYYYYSFCTLNGLNAQKHPVLRLSYTEIK